MTSLHTQSPEPDLALVQGSPEWHDARNKRIGGSDIASIKGISPWKSAYQLMQEKRFGLRQAVNSNMKFGTDNEDKARQLFIQETGIFVTPKVGISPVHDWKIASVDGLGELCLVELKCPNKDVFEKAKQGIIVPYYYCQVQWNLDVFGLDQGYYYCVHGKETALVSCPRNKEYCDVMHNEAQAFWEMWQRGEMPEAMDDDHHIIDTEDWDACAKRLMRIRSRLADLEAEEKACKSELLDMAKGNNAIGSGIKVTKSIRKGAIQYGSIPELTNLDLEQYRKEPSTVWTITEA